MPAPEVKLPFEFGKPLRWAGCTAAHTKVCWRYGVAVAVVLAAAGICVTFEPIIGIHKPYLPFALAVIAASLFGGRGPGLAASLLSACIVDWLFLRPLGSFTMADRTAIWGFGLFVLGVIVIALLAAGLRESLLAWGRAE